MAISDDDKRALGREEAQQALPEGWRLVLDQVVAHYDTGGFSAGAAFVQRVAELADAADHHPDVDLRYPHVTVALSSHDVGAITARDTRLAAEIHQAATEAGIAVGQAPDKTEVALDVRDKAALGPFYAALLGYDRPDDDALVDPASRGPQVWFQDTDSDAVDRQRWHLDVSVPHDVAEQRVQAVLDAGGRLVDESFVPAFWVLEDAEGNRSCICTWQARD
ncbi:4a-hydroxytetrahydrobiopterin dehydratase [Nocardioides marmoraquaticus]